MLLVVEPGCDPDASATCGRLMLTRGIYKGASPPCSIDPWQDAAEKCFSWSNRDAILMLPERVKVDS